MYKIYSKKEINILFKNYINTNYIISVLLLLVVIVDIFFICASRNFSMLFFRNTSEMKECEAFWSLQSDDVLPTTQSPVIVSLPSQIRHSPKEKINSRWVWMIGLRNYLKRVQLCALYMR